MPQTSRNRKSKTSGTAAKSQPTLITSRVLRAWPLPESEAGGDKEDRGRVVIVGGSRQMPGALLLAGTAALRAGAGKVQLATVAEMAAAVACALPEARVFALPETKAGGIATAAVDRITEQANQADALLVGPGIVDERAIVRLLRALLPRLEKPSLVLDATALECLVANPDCLRSLRRRAVITPHAGELANLVGEEKTDITADPLRWSRQTAERFHAVVMLKGAETYIAAPGAQTYLNRAGNLGLATSGSGDTLAGVVVALAARGAEAQQAAVWGTYLHARAGERLAARTGPLGYLARELSGELPALLAELSR
jgi:ADP-dependent NAD(P)H-hydrate dehydratase